MSREPQLITFHQRTDIGTFVGGLWPEMVLIADDLLAASDGHLMTGDRETVTIKVVNGYAIYRRVGQSYNGASRFERGEYSYTPMGDVNAA